MMIKATGVVLYVLDISTKTWCWKTYERKKAKAVIRLWIHKDTPNYTLTGELWGVFSEFSGEKIPRDIVGTLLRLLGDNALSVHLPLI